MLNLFIYGLLDKEGNTVQNDAKKNEKLKYDEEVSLDVVRKKAYGILDEELELKKFMEEYSKE